MIRALSVFALATALSACTHPTGSVGDTPPPSTATDPAAEAPPQEESTSRGSPVFTIVTRDARVTVVASGTDDLRFVVRNPDGAIVADGITADALRSAHPMLHAIVTNAFASSGSSRAKSGETILGKTYLDATL